MYTPYRVRSRRSFVRSTWGRPRGGGRRESMRIIRSFVRTLHGAGTPYTVRMTRSPYGVGLEGIGDTMGPSIFLLTLN